MNQERVTLPVDCCNEYVRLGLPPAGSPCAIQLPETTPLVQGFKGQSLDYRGMFRVTVGPHMYAQSIIIPVGWKELGSEARTTLEHLLNGHDVPEGRVPILKKVADRQSGCFYVPLEVSYAQLSVIASKLLREAWRQSQQRPFHRRHPRWRSSRCITNVSIALSATRRTLSWRWR